MFGKNQVNVQIPLEPKAKLEPYEIHTMPVKFHKFLKPKKTNFGRLLLIGVIILIFIVGAGLGAYYFFVVLQQGGTMPLNMNLPVLNLNENDNKNANVNAITNVNENANINENINAVNVNANENVNVSLNTNTNANVNINADVNANLNVNQPVVPTPVSFFSSQDSDRDNLTDVEEELYSTERNLPDTDADGYLDGLELIGLYNPRAGSGSLLELSGLINSYENPGFNYKIFYPAKWLAKPLDQSLKEVIFQSNTEEYISVVVEDNPDQLALVDWFITQATNDNLNLMEKKITKNDMEALISANKLTYYLYSERTPDKVYVVGYNIGKRVLINFTTTFEMMANSFEIVPKL